jgi:hypothetical protein
MCVLDLNIRRRRSRRRCALDEIGSQDDKCKKAKENGAGKIGRSPDNEPDGSGHRDGSQRPHVDTQRPCADSQRPCADQNFVPGAQDKLQQNLAGNAPASHILVTFRLGQQVARRQVFGKA